MKGNIGKIFAKYGMFIIIIILILLLLIGMRGYLAGGGLFGGSSGTDGGADGGTQGGQPATGTNCGTVCRSNNYDTGYGPVTNSWDCAKTYYSVSANQMFCCCQDTYAPPGSCYDTDAGNDIWKKGTCSDGRVTMTDDCASQTYVNENWCEGGACWGASMLCPAGYHCWDGACILAQSACSGVWNPTPETCAAAYCASGICIYHPATIYGVAYCNCDYPT